MQLNTGQDYANNSQYKTLFDSTEREVQGRTECWDAKRVTSLAADYKAS